MTEAEWLACKTSPVRMLAVLREKGSPRKYRLCAVAFCGTILPLLAVHRREDVEKVVAVAERFADGLVTEEELRQVREDTIPWDFENRAAIESCNSDPRFAVHYTMRHTANVVLNVKLQDNFPLPQRRKMKQ